MRSIILTAAFALIAGSAAASSIVSVGGQQGGDSSITSLRCVSCPPLKPPVIKKTYIVPDLAAGTQKIEVRDINGEQKVVRTEAWMGGSPVTFISKATPEALAAAGQQTDGVDTTATAAVPPENPPAPVAPKPLDVSGFGLRLN